MKKVIEGTTEVVSVRRSYQKALGAARRALVAIALVLPCAQLQAADESDGDGDLRITVTSGDTLTSIVQRELGGLNDWGEVARFNKLDQPDVLVPGAVIVIPHELLQKRNFATVVFAKGASTTLHNSIKKPVVKGDSIYIGDLISTGKTGFVSLSFNGSTLVNLQPDSKVRLEALDCVNRTKSCLVNLRAIGGQLNLDVQSEGFQQPTTFIIDTPYASAAVRGTKFDFDTLDGNILGVTEGAVEIRIDGEVAIVPAGKGTLSGQGRSIKDQFDLLPEPIPTKNQRISPQDLYTWQKLDGAQTYRASISRADTPTDVIRRTSGERRYIETAPEPGRYVVRMRAIDSRGLKGFVAVKEFRVLEVDDQAEAPALDIELSDEIMRIKPQGLGSVEVRFSETLELIGETEVLINHKAFDIPAGQTFEARIDPSKPLYIQARRVLDAGTVSSYGSLYEFSGSER